MKKIEGSIIIQKQVHIVKKQFLDSTNYGEYQDGFIKKELVSGTEGTKGCVSTLYYKYGNRDMILTETIIDNNLPNSFEAFYHHQHMDNTMKCNFIEIDDTTTKYNFEYDYTRINWFMPKLLSILFPGMYRRQGEKWMQQFKTYVESSQIK